MEELQTDRMRMLCRVELVLLRAILDRRGHR
jgi:hypothetical protein